MSVSRILSLIIPSYYKLEFPAKLNRKIDLKVKNRPLRVILKQIARLVDATVLTGKYSVKFATEGSLFPISDEKVLEKVEFKDVALIEILRALADLCDVNILIDPSADTLTQNRVNFFVKELNYRSTFELLLSVNRLKSKVVSGRTLMILSEAAYKEKVELAFHIFKLESSDATKTDTRIKNIFASQDPNLKITVNQTQNSLEVNCDPQILPKIIKFIEKAEVNEVEEITERIPVWNAVLKAGPNGDELTNLISIVKESLEEYKLPSKIVADPRNKSLILTGTPYQLSMTKKIIKALDIRRKQVLIQVRVMEINQTEANRLGLAPTTDSATISSIHSIPKIKDIPISATLDFLVKKNKARTRANPSIRVIDGETANIEIGQEIPVIIREKQTFNNPNTQSVVSNGNTTSAALPVDFVTETARIERVSIKLAMTPTIHSDGQISLKVNINQDDLIQVIDFAGVQKAFRTVDTFVTVRNGETIIIGGLISQKTTKEVREWPLLSRIPLIKKVFKNRNIASNQTELVIFLTPTLVNLKRDDPYEMSRIKQGVSPNLRTY